MDKSYKGVFEQFAQMAEYVIKEGAPVLDDYAECGDYTLFMINRKMLAEAELSPEDQKRLEKLDRGIAKGFTTYLLMKYVYFEPGVIEWWGKKGNEREHLQRLIEMIRESEYRTDYECYQYVDFAFKSLVVHVDQNRNSDLWDELGEVIKRHSQLAKDGKLYDTFTYNYHEMPAKGYWWYDPENW